jgi:hypothetical protein
MWREGLPKPLQTARAAHLRAHTMRPYNFVIFAFFVANFFSSLIAALPR